MKKKGRLICVEGIDQSGKKTQVGLLIKRLEKQGFQLEKISFPDYDTPLGKEIQAFLVGKREYNVHVRHILYAANRWERKPEIEEWLNKERLVIVNRYSHSNLAYGLANGLDIPWLLNLENGLPKADLVIVIDISPEASFKRKSFRRDIYERNLSFLRKVREAYMELSEKFPWVVVNGEKSIERTHENIWQVVNKFLKKKL